MPIMETSFLTIKKQIIMKKLFMLLIFDLLCVAMFSQARIGYSLDDIKKEFSAPDIKMNQGIHDDGTIYLTFRITEAPARKMYFAFDGDRDCNVTIVEPETQGGLNAITEFYNSKYTVLSPITWRAYLTNVILYCELTYPDGGGKPYFIWIRETGSK